jgi:hypothetical protein
VTKVPMIAVVKKILIDQLIYAPIFTCVLYIFLQTAQLDIDGIPHVLEVRVSLFLMLPHAVHVT